MCATAGLLALAPSAFAVAPVNTVPPSISGTPQQGETLTADVGEWVEDPLDRPRELHLPVAALQRPLQRDRRRRRHHLPARGRGRGRHDPGGGHRHRHARRRAPPPSPTPRCRSPPEPTQPVVTEPPDDLGHAAGRGAAHQDQRDRVPGTPPRPITYQWRRCNAAGNGCSNIGGQTGTTYTLVQADAGADDPGPGDGAQQRRHRAGKQRAVRPGGGLTDQRRPARGRRLDR